MSLCIIWAKANVMEDIMTIQTLNCTSLKLFFCSECVTATDLKDKQLVQCFPSWEDSPIRGKFSLFKWKSEATMINQENNEENITILDDKLTINDASQCCSIYA